MSTNDDSASPIVAAFLKRYLRDVDRGTPRSLAAYQDEFPGYEDAIAAEYEALAAGEDERDLDRIGRYRIERVLGRGGQGEVFLATDDDLGRPVAIKLLRELRDRDTATLQRFHREAAVAARLDHPGIATVYEVGVDQDVHFIAMRYVDGRTLAQSIADDRQARRLPDATAIERYVEIIERVAGAAHIAHEAGVLHRDLKPSNIIVKQDGTPVILDFGLARDLAGDAGMTVTHRGGLLGTPDYMAPEQVAGDRVTIDRRTDVYSLGATLYECVTVCRPFEALTRGALLNAILVKDVAAPSALNPDVPSAIDAVIQRAMAKDPARRYPDAASLAADLAAARAGRSLSTVPDASAPHPAATGRPARASLWGIATALAAGIVLGFAVRHVTAPANRPAIPASAIGHERVLEAFLYGISDRRADLDALDRLDEPLAHAVAVLARYGRAGRTAAAEHLATLPAHPCLVPLRRWLTQGGSAPAEARTAAPTHRSLFVDGLIELTRAREGDRAAFDRAAGLLNRAMVAAPTSPRLYVLHLLEATARRGDAARARDLAVAARTRWPDEAAVWSWLGFARIVGGFGDDAAAHQRAVDVGPNDRVAHVIRARALAAVGRPADAALAWRAALTVDPDTPAVWRSLGIALVKTGDLVESKSALRRGLQRRRNDYRARMMLARVLTLEGRLEAASDEYQRAARIRPGTAEPWARVSLAFSALEEQKAAARALDRTAGLDDAPRLVAFARGVLCALRAAWPDARRALQQAVDAPPPVDWDATSEARLWTTLGDAYAATEAWPEAIRAFDRALASGRADASVLHRAGVVRERAGDATAAITAYRRALRDAPEDRQSAERLAALAEKRGDFESLVIALERLVTIGRDDEELHVRRGNALMRLGRFDEARRHFRAARALQLDSSKRYEEFIWRIDRIEAEVAEMDRALASRTAVAPQVATRYARRASRIGRYADAVHFWRQALDRPQDDDAAAVSWASCVAAARDACRAIGPDRDAAALRLAAITWLERAHDAEALEGSDAVARLRKWRADPDFLALHGARIESLPLAERVRLRGFWARVEARAGR